MRLARRLHSQLNELRRCRDENSPSSLAARQVLELGSLSEKRPSRSRLASKRPNVKRAGFVPPAPQRLGASKGLFALHLLRRAALGAVKQANRTMTSILFGAFPPGRRPALHTPVSEAAARYGARLLAARAAGAVQTMALQLGRALRARNMGSRPLKHTLRLPTGGGQEASPG